MLSIYAREKLHDITDKLLNFVLQNLYHLISFLSFDIIKKANDYSTKQLFYRLSVIDVFLKSFAISNTIS